MPRKRPTIVALKTAPAIAAATDPDLDVTGPVTTRKPSVKELALLVGKPQPPPPKQISVRSARRRARRANYPISPYHKWI